MDETGQSHTLTHRLSWDLRLVGLGIGCLFVALPYLMAYKDEAMGRGISALWVLGGMAMIALFVFANTTMLTVDGKSLTLRRSGLFGRKTDVLPLDAIKQVEVMRIPSRATRASFCVAVKVRGWRQTFMGENHQHREVASAEAARFRRLAGMG